MRKAESIIREMKCKIPKNYKKVDTSVNGDAETLVEKHKEVEKKLYPLRIDKRTVIYVTKDKLTPEYAENARNKFQHKFDEISPGKGGNSPLPLDVGVMKRMLDEGMTMKDIARDMGVSRTTVGNYIARFNLRETGKISNPENP